jgi:glycosyltransferase involved in cell wall biosynthesis
MSVHYSLPNKFFEALAAGLGVVVGPSPSMSWIVSRYGLGSVVKTWKVRHLAEAINELTPDAINEAKINTSRALFEYSDKKIQEKFFRALEIVHN